VQKVWKWLTKIVNLFYLVVSLRFSLKKINKKQKRIEKMGSRIRELELDKNWKKKLEIDDLIREIERLKKEILLISNEFSTKINNLSGKE
jgi:hypothetical protein